MTSQSPPPAHTPLTPGRIVVMIALPLVVVMLGMFAMNVLAAMRKPPAARPPEDTRGPLVETWTVVTTQETFTLRSQGTVKSPRETAISPQVSGRVIRVADSLASGGYFEPGAELIWLDPADFEQAAVNARYSLAQAQTRLSQEQAEANVAREEWKRMGRSGDPPALAVRAPQIAEAEAAVAAAQAALEKAERDLGRTVVKAPDYRGRVKSVAVNVGQYITPMGQPVAIVYSVEAAEVELRLALDDLAFVDLPLWPEGNGSVSGDANQDRPQPQPPVTLSATVGRKRWTRSGRIVRTGGAVDPQTRQFTAVARVDDPMAADPEQPGRPPLWLDLFVEAEITGRATGRVVRLPRKAVHNGNVVHVVEAGSLTFREVQVVRSTLDDVLVLAVPGRLDTDELVVMTSLAAPVEGMKVRVQGDDSVVDLSETPVSAPPPPGRSQRGGNR